MLRVLQTRAFEPVGGTRTIDVDVRLITATHQDLKSLIRAERFREDLYYRLNVISIEIPGLAQRREDIVELAIHFLQRSSSRIGKAITDIDEPAVAALLEYDWPGNIRELENAIERATVLTDGDVIMLEDLPEEVRLGNNPAGATMASHAVTLPHAELDEPPRPLNTGNERDRLLEALQESGGNKARAARALGIPRSTFFSQLKKHGLD